jgi:hypothetical protein
MPNYCLHADNVKLELVLIKGLTYPLWSTETSSQIINQYEVDDTQTILIDIPVTNDTTSILLKNYGKTDQDTIIEDGRILADQTLTVNKIWINDILLENFVVKDYSQMIPNYNQSNLNYADEHNIILDKILNTNTMHYNGVWKFNFEQPFFKWYNKILIDKLSNFNHWVSQSHLGLADDDKVKTLKKLLDQM